MFRNCFIFIRSEKKKKKKENAGDNFHVITASAAAPALRDIVKRERYLRMNFLSALFSSMHAVT